MQIEKQKKEARNLNRYMGVTACKQCRKMTFHYGWTDENGRICSVKCNVCGHKRDI